MAKSEMVHARIDPELKGQAEALFEQLGLSMSSAFTLFCRQAVLHRGLPFPVKIPNATTQRAMRDSRARRDLKRYQNVDDLFGATED